MSRIQLPRLSRIAVAAAASAALIGTAFIAPATALAAPASGNAPAAAAADASASAPLVTNDPAYDQGPYTSDKTDNKIQVFGQIAAYTTADGSGDASWTNAVGTKYVPDKTVGHSIIDASQVKSIYQVMTIKNTSDATFTVDNEQMALPRFYLAYSNDSKSVTVDPSAFKDGALDPSLVTNPLTNQTITYSYKNVDGTWPGTVTPTNLEKVIVSGDLAAGASITIRVPLTLPDLSKPDAGVTFSIGHVANSIDSGAVPETSVSLAKPLTAPDGSNTIPFKGAFLATVKSTGADGSSVFTTVPSMQQYMPLAVNGGNYWVSNFGAPTVGGATTDILYKGGYYTVDATQIADAVKTHGYAQELADGKPMTAYIYRTFGGVAPVVDPDGNAVDWNPNRTATYVSIRPVVTGNDVSLTVGDSFDALTNEALGLKVFGHDGATLPDLAAAVASGDVTIDGTVDTNTPGTYPITVTYVPDGVSNTFTVTVAGPSTTPTPGEPGSATPGTGAEAGSGAEVKTSGTGSAADLAGLGIALAAAGAGTAAAARRIRRNRH